MTTWQTVHESFRELSFDKSSFDVREAHWIRAGHATRVWEGVGCATFVEYLSMMLGYRGNTARDRIRTALALADLPEIEDALAGGRICWSAARELTRVVTPATQAVWLDAAEGHAVREIEDMVAGLHPGDVPGTTRDRGAERRILRFEVSGATYAAFREAAQVITREAGQALSDDQLIDLLARRVLGGPADDGRASYQIAITRCSDCARTFASGAGQLVQVDPAMVEVIECDGQVVPVDAGAGEAHVSDAHATAAGVSGMSQAGDGAARGGDGAADGAGTLHVADSGATHGGDGGATHVGDGGATHVGDGGATHGGDGGATHGGDGGTTHGGDGGATHGGDGGATHGGDGGATHGGDGGTTHGGDRACAHATSTTNPRRFATARASQTVPPKTRRSVLRAYHNRCAAPGCRSSVYIDVHHIVLRSEGGDDTPSNLVPLCSAHHRAVHEGRLSVRRTVAGLEFRHPDGTVYGRASAVSPTAAGARSRVFQALLELGFRHRQVVEALGELAPMGSDADLMRAALDRLQAKQG